jgi:1-acyl-sn-glycerol-3-phosphate acyltransferase
MHEACGRWWRILATGLSFVTFGIGALFFRIVLFPALLLRVRQKQKRIALARAVIRMAFRFFVGLMQALGVLRYEVIGRHLLEREGLLILANHPTLIDTVFLMAIVKDADCIVKSALWNNPFTSGPVRTADYISNAQGMELVQDCIATLERGNNLIVFPEGTRTNAEGVLHFKRGAANIAVRGRRDVTPVLISCTPGTLGKGNKWWQVPLQRAQFRIEVREDIKIDRFIHAGTADTIAARQLTTYLENYFSKESQPHA